MKGRVTRRGSSPLEKTGGLVTMNKAIYEGSDYFLDMETSIQKKKRSRGKGLYVSGNGTLDESYASFLNGLHEFWEGKLEEEDTYDPVYLAFLENLKEHENAYMCDVSRENGVLFPIIYEVEDDSPNEIKRKTLRSRSGAAGNCIPEKTNSCQNCDLKSTRKNYVAEIDSCDEVWRMVDDPKSSLTKSDSGNNHPDGNKRKTPQSHSGTASTCIRERKNSCQDRDLKATRKNYGAKNDSCDEVWRMVDDPKFGLKKFDSGNNHPDRIKRKTSQSCRGDNIKGKKSLDMGKEQRSGPKYSGVGKKMSTEVDETYEKFLKGLHVTNESVFYEYGNKEQVFYETSDQQTTFVEIEPLERDTRPPPMTVRSSTPIPRPPTPPSRAHTILKKPTPTGGHNSPSTSVCVRSTSASDFHQLTHDITVHLEARCC